MLADSDNQPESKVVLVGDAGVGKTAIIQCFVNGRIDELYDATIVATTFKTTVQLRDGKKEEITIWDTAGQERFQSLIPLYLRNARGLILVADVTAKNNIQTLNAIRTSLTDIDTGCVCILAANKIDLVTNKIFPDLQKWSKEHNFLFTTCSAKTGFGIEDLFLKIANEIHENTVDEEFINNNIVVSNENRRRFCC